MFWEIFSLLLGAVIGGFTSWIFERRAAKDDRARHQETLQHNEQLLLSNEKLQARIDEFERSQHHMQNLMNEGFASAARTGEVSPVAVATGLDETSVLAELRARLDAGGRAPISGVRSTFLAEGHSAQSFDAIIEQLIQSGVIRRDGKALTFL
ncbi:MAG: hypothetical protein GX862_04010 [Leucobacter sp.]|nr:hypothetical protein [Leucobacter sp.]